MKNILFALLALLLLASAQQAKAQKYFVYDGEDFSVMFTCTDDNARVNEIDFSSKDSNGEWKWNKFDIYKYTSLDDDEIGATVGKGFIYYCKDANGAKFAVDYIRDEDYLLVYHVDENGKVGDKTWKLTRRADSK
jgi:hypothetical protein